MTMKISLMLLTLDRFDLTKKCWELNYKNSKLPESEFEWELLVCDNGSKDKRVIEYFASIADYHRVNLVNEGVGRSFNQLYLRSTGDIIVLLGNDLINPENWIEIAVDHIKKIPNSGLVGFNWGVGMPTLTKKNGVAAHYLNKEFNRVFGTWVFKRRIIEEIGFFYDDFDVYGLEDSDMNERVNRAGFNSYYIPHKSSKHLGVGQHDEGEYREMKNKSMEINAKIFSERLSRYDEDGIKCELPPMRDPL